MKNIMNFTKSNFKRNLKVKDVYLSGNNFWFDAAQYGQHEDQNLHADFEWMGARYFLVEYIGYTNGGASWSSVTISKYGTDEVVFSDNYHDGNGAWQTSDGYSSRCEYSDLTKHILKVLGAHCK